MDTTNNVLLKKPTYSNTMDKSNNSDFETLSNKVNYKSFVCVFNNLNV